MSMAIKHNYNLGSALAIARTIPPVAGARVVALLDVNGIIYRGNNSRKTHPLMARFGKNDKAICLHAEVDAIKRALGNELPSGLVGSTMYIARAKADGSPGLAKPCEGCQRALVAFGISEVYWTE